MAVLVEGSFLVKVASLAMSLDGFRLGNDGCTVMRIEKKPGAPLVDPIRLAVEAVGDNPSPNDVAIALDNGVRHGAAPKCRGIHEEMCATSLTPHQLSHTLRLWPLWSCYPTRRPSIASTSKPCCQTSLHN